MSVLPPKISTTNSLLEFDACDDQRYHPSDRWRRCMNGLKSLVIVIVIGMAFCPFLAGQQPFGSHLTRVRPFTTVDDVLNREAEASDPAGIHQYSEDLLGLTVPDRAGYSYLNVLTARLANAEQLAREGRGKLVSEAEIVRVFNDLMRKIGAPPTFKADEAGIRKFRARSIVIQAFPALLSTNRNGTNCTPAEAIYLLHLLLWNDGILSERLVDDLAAFKLKAEQKNGLSVMSAGTTPSQQSAGVLVSDYSLHHHRRATIEVFDGIARTFGF
jgi:hypothetical protein